MLQFTFVVPQKEIKGFLDKIPEAKKSGLARVIGDAQQIADRKVLAIRRRKVPTRREQALYRQRKRTRRTNRRPRPITASNKPLWTPTGNLAKAVEASPIFDEPDEVALVADVPYAASRHDLGTDEWMPKDPSLGVVRKDTFFADAIEVVEPRAPELFIDGWNEVMER